MTDYDAEIIIAGTRRDWPGGTRTLTPRDPCRDPDGTLWFGADLGPDPKQVWFRVASEDVRRIRAETPRTRGDRVIEALLAWLSLGHRLQDELTRFEVRVSDHGDAWVERLRVVRGGPPFSMT